MGTIVERKRADGSAVYVAQILLKQKGKIVFREGRTFTRKPAAADWIKLREEELRRPGGLEAVQKRKSQHITLSDAIDRYLQENEKGIGRTKAQVLRTIKGYDIAAMSCEAIRSEHIFEFARTLRQKVAPQTVGNYLSHLSAIFTLARPAWGIPLDEQAMKDAQVVSKRMGTASKSKERDRRPTIVELDKLLEHFTDRAKRSPKSAPMTELILFALFSARRQEEITRLCWDDLDEEHSRILVRDMKHPGQKIGNDQWCDLVPEALAIIKRQPKKDARIFPYGTDAISASFTRACPVLGIVDLRFHDLRHEGISRLAELGWSIPHMAAVSGHRSWVSLKRYTHIRTRTDKYDGWKWRPTRPNEADTTMKETTVGA
ncbi:site-specific integrase [Rhizobium sp. SSA_523]|uniref:site-specific integrase n=1 Tax=Rhizobium sp. SSA_523 TaxID=2952477 RepID=UPI002090F91C|nr:site-specific integrase [Rhizobium sp. SSA_523]MCO5730057.1 site-specific integrase [Rhizobium sp. SSA_523]WKC25123.1 site-specific integrase [Rhizobium sp. SSA_523]